MNENNSNREGSLEAPTRHPIDWQSDTFYDRAALDAELERVFDICHGCRRCVSLCQAFPTLFDLVDESDTMEVDGVDKADYQKVVDECYLCDLCYMTKCPYVPPHPWEVDFPHLMLRAKAVKHLDGGLSLRDRFLTSTDVTGKLAGIPVITETVNAVNRNGLARKALQSVLGIHEDANLPPFARPDLRQRLAKSPPREDGEAVSTERTTGKVAIFATCYGEYQMPELVEDLVAILDHNRLPVTVVQDTRCCGMPKLEMGDFSSVNAFKERNIPRLLELVDAGYDLTAPVPSCVLMFKQELRLMYPDDADVQRVAAHMFDPFQYLLLRHDEGLLNTDFRTALGKVAYHVACHLRVQNIGLKTRDLLSMAPDTEFEVIERCAGHDGTYGVRRESHENSMKIGRPVFRKVGEAEPAHYASDCPIACKHIEHGCRQQDADVGESEHPLKLLRLAYGI